MLKRYTAGKLSETADKKSLNSKQKEAKGNDVNWDDQSSIDQTTLDHMKDHWTGTLTSVSSDCFCSLQRSERGLGFMADVIICERTV